MEYVEKTLKKLKIEAQTIQEIIAVIAQAAIEAGHISLANAETCALDGLYVSYARSPVYHPKHRTTEQVIANAIIMYSPALSTFYLSANELGRGRAEVRPRAVHLSKLSVYSGLFSLTVAAADDPSKPWNYLVPSYTAEPQGQAHVVYFVVTFASLADLLQYAFVVNALPFNPTEMGRVLHYWALPQGKENQRTLMRTYLRSKNYLDFELAMSRAIGRIKKAYVLNPLDPPMQVARNILAEEYAKMFAPQEEKNTELALLQSFVQARLLEAIHEKPILGPSSVQNWFTKPGAEIYAKMLATI